MSQILLLAGCAEKGNKYRANVYSVPQINQSHTTKNVEIVAITPAQFGMGKELIDGVQITYSLDRVTATSVQVGRICEFQNGAGLLISSAPNETRIQPNKTCGASSAR